MLMVAAHGYPVLGLGMNQCVCVGGVRLEYALCGLASERC